MAKMAKNDKMTQVVKMATAAKMRKWPKKLSNWPK